LAAVRLRVAATPCGTDEHFVLAPATISIQSSSGNRFSRAHNTALFGLIFRTHMRHHRQAAVAPELTLRPESMRRVDGGDNQCTSNGSQLRNGSQQADPPDDPGSRPASPVSPAGAGTGPDPVLRKETPRVVARPVRSTSPAI